MIVVGRISTKPELDPYHYDMGGVCRTVLKMTEEGLVYVSQDYRNDSTPIDEWLGKTLTWNIPDHPLEKEVRDFINDNMELFETVHRNHTVEWNGRNIAGHLAEAGRDAVEKIECMLDCGFTEVYEWWAAEDWMEDTDVPVFEDNEALEAYAQTIRDEAEDTIVILGLDNYLKRRMV